MPHSSPLYDPSLTLALALAIGILAQAVARHLQLPGIVLLLAVGVALGPDGANLIRPDALGGGLHALVGFAVAVILFEGGLNLDLRRLRRAQRPIRRLVTVGAFVTAVGGTLAARLLMGWDWRQCALFGALVIVTGPTVVTPLLRRVKVQAAVATVLEAEGVLIDAVGAVAAAFALEVALSPSGSTVALGLATVAARLGVGALTGGVVGLFLALLLRRRHLVPEGLENTFTLALVLVLFHGSNALLSESGIAAVTVAGIIVGNARTHVHRDLLEFKEQLTVLLIGVIFVLLAADVRLAEIRALGSAGALTVAVLVVLIRPLDVLVSTWGSRLDWRQRLFIGWIGPRGIIAAAIASLFAAELDRHGVSGGHELRALVFLVIAVTVLLAGATGGAVAGILRLRQRASGWLILGAHDLARLVARLLVDQGQEVLCLDSNPDACNAAEREGLQVIQGNALSERTLERARAHARLGAIALSTNEELNLLFVQRVKRQAHLGHLFAALRNLRERVTGEMLHRVDARLLFGRPVDVALWSMRLRRGLASVATFEQVRKKDEQRERDTTVTEMGELYVSLLLQRGKTVTPVSEQTRFRRDDIATFLLFEERRDEARQQLAQLGWEEQATQPPSAP